MTSVAEPNPDQILFPCYNFGKLRTPERLKFESWIYTYNNNNKNYIKTQQYKMKIVPDVAVCYLNLQQNEL